MAGQIQPQQLTLQVQLLPGRKLRHVRIFDIPIWRLYKIKQLNLQIIPFFPPFQRRFDRLVQHRQQLRAMTRQGIKRPALNQRLDHPLIAGPQIHPPAKIEQAVERTLFPFFQNTFDRLGPDVFDRGQAKADHA
ncbi:hypothetical protein D3C81_975580 [compost metagenome]